MDAEEIDSLRSLFIPKIKIGMIWILTMFLGLKKVGKSITFIPRYFMFVFVVRMYSNKSFNIIPRH